jgi:hypothetical protein
MEVALVALPVLARADARSVKLGQEVATLLRPDRLVAYFSGFAPLRAAAAELTPLLAGIPAQGVPFTAQLDSNGLVSWGMDPVPAQGARKAMSWREWITGILGRAIFIARRSGTSRPASVSFALRRLALEAVDPVTFAPRGDVEMPAVKPGARG